MIKRWIALFSLALLPAACGDDGGSADPDASPDAEARSCDESITQTTPNDPPCTWEWTCSDFAGQTPQYSLECAEGSGDDVECECREAGAVTGNATIADGCLNIADACQAANAACGFTEPITCD